MSLQERLTAHLFPRRVATTHVAHAAAPSPSSADAASDPFATRLRALLKLAPSSTATPMGAATTAATAVGVHYLAPHPLPSLESAHGFAAALRPQPTIPRRPTALAETDTPASAVAALTAAAATAYMAGESAASSDARRSAATTYAEFTRAHELPAFPVSLQTLAVFATHYVTTKGNSPGSLTGLLSHVVQASLASHPTAHLSDADRAVLGRVVEGLARTYIGQNATGKAVPIRLADLDRILTHLGSISSTEADRHEVLSLLCQEQLLLRAGELAKVCKQDITWVLHPGAAASPDPPLSAISYAEVRLASPKTAKKGTQVVGLAHRDDRFDTIAQLYALLQTKASNDLVFTRTVHGKMTQQPISSVTVTSIVRKWVLAAGVVKSADEAKTYRSHSQRRGGARDLRDAGHADASTSQGRWATQAGQDAYVADTISTTLVAALKSVQPVVQGAAVAPAPPTQVATGIVTIPRRKRMRGTV